MIDVDDFVHAVIYDLITAHISHPLDEFGVLDEPRHISIFQDTFEITPYIDTVEDQLAIASLYDLITPMLKSNGMGFKITKEGQTLRPWVFKGHDRSANQSARPVVTFSDNFDNVLSSSFYTSRKGMINIVQVIGDDEVHDSVSVWEENTDEPEGLDRFEGVLEEIVERDNDDPPLNDDQILAIVLTKGREVVADNKQVDILDGDFDIHGSFKYGVDFFMGDIVQCYVEERHTTARIIEIVRSYTESGSITYVAFDILSDETVYND